MTKEEKAAWDHLRERKQECDREIAELEDLLKKNHNGRTRQLILDNIEHEKKLKRIEAARTCMASGVAEE